MEEKEEKTESNNIILKCRHCQTENELNKSEMLYNLKKIECKNCKGNLFLEKEDKFTNISPYAYEHPLEKNAMKTLRAIPGLEDVLRNILKNFTDRYFQIYFMQNFVKVSETHVKSLYKKLVKVSEMFDLGYIPELYIVQHSFDLSAFVVGVDKAFVGISSYMLNLLTDDEIEGVLAHEISHIKSQHLLYKTLARIVGTIGVVAASIYLQVGVGIGGLAELLTLPLKQALNYWDRCSELSADRAEMLYIRDYNQFINTRMKLSSGVPTKFKDEFDIKEFEKQADEIYKMEKNFMDKIAMVFQESNETHPFPVWRIGAIREWLNEEDFYEVIQGRYKKIGDEQNSDKSENTNDFDKFIKDVKNFFGMK